MNQILSTSNNYDGYNKNETKKIIIIFCIILILVAIILIALTVDRIHKNKERMSQYAKPEIVINEESDSQIMLKASCEDGIKYIIYTWNYDTENRVNLNGDKTFERIIDIPDNKNNTLEISVVSIKDVKADLARELTKSEVDTDKPSIDGLVVAGSRLNIEASDASGIKCIIYKWENEEEQTVYPGEDEDNKNVNIQIDIERGTHKLNIKAVDIYDNSFEISRLVTGVNEPEISAIKYDDIVEITVTHDMGIKEIGVLINEQFYEFNEQSSDYTTDTTITLKYPLEEGENIIKVIAYSLEKLSDENVDSLDNYSFKTYVGKCTYGVEQEEDQL